MARRKRELRIGDLFDYLAEHPDGSTIDEISDDFGISHPHANSLIQGLRDLLAEDTINVPCDPDPDDPNGRWLYRLAGDYESIERWATNRVLDTERRLQTQLSVVTSIVAGARPNSIHGRKARVIKKTLSRLLEDLSEITEDGDAS